MRLATALGLVLAVLPLVGNADTASLAHEVPAQAAPQPLAPRGPTTREEMEAFIDGFMNAQMHAGPIAGAVVAVVKDGELFFSKGYGYENVEQRVAVDPEQTLFRPGSVSKLFTWTAVMQQVEQGKLDLDADVNGYLKEFQLPARFPQPVTLRNLMTHTPGFEDGAVGYLFANKPEDLLPLNEWLVEHMPLRARPPTTDFADGTNASYSNWGTALAGHIVELVSGMSFDEYVERHIFQPLGMQRSTFREPLPEHLASRMSGGYIFEGGEFARRGFEFIHAAGPAGSMSATATDMAKFMLAHLQDGSLGEARILAPATARLMHTRTMSPDPALNGQALGFYETWINGRRIIGHGGNTQLFHTVLSLLPEQRLGLFASVNSGGDGAGASVALERAFFEHYFPATLPPLQPPGDANKRNERYAGVYRSLRRSYTSFEKIFAGLGDDKVVAMPDGTLLMPTVDDKLGRWVEIGDGVFRARDHDLFVAFKGNDGGHATHLVGPFPPIISTRVSWYESTTLHAFIAAVSVVLFVTISVSAIRRRRADRELAASQRWARPVLAVAGLLLLLYLLGTVVSLADFESLIFNIPTSLYVAATFALLAIPFTLAAIYFAARTWQTRTWTLGSRVHYTLATLAAVAFLVVLNYWNLLGYRFG